LSPNNNIDYLTAPYQQLTTSQLLRVIVISIKNLYVKFTMLLLESNCYEKNESKKKTLLQVNPKEKIEMLVNISLEQSIGIPLKDQLHCL